ncbi:MAG: M4 family metallopeptidase, partial [Bacteroidota bacterium]
MQRFILVLLLLIGQPALSAQHHSTPQDRALLKKSGASWLADRNGYATIAFEQPLAYASKVPEQATQAFLDVYGPALGWAPAGPEETIILTQKTQDLAGNHHLRFQQYNQGVLVLGGTCTITTNAAGAIKSFNGRLLPSSSFVPASAQNSRRLDVRTAIANGLRGQYPQVDQWTIREEAPIWVSPSPWTALGKGQLHLTRTFIVEEPGGYQAEKVFLDATSGAIIFKHQLHCDLNRRLYHRNTAGFNLVWREGDNYPGDLAADDQELLLSTEEFYNLMYRTFGRQSYDGNNSQMRGVTNAFLNNCPNANAGGNVIRACTGVVGDDIVGHEWTHNYIRSMNGLIYAFESGAINEAYADIFGECLDLLNDRGIDTNDHLPRTGCRDNNVRWKIAEDATAIDTTLRDYWYPECKHDASSRDSPFYRCATEADDAGGVHTNSGLVNRTFALLVDGGVVEQDTIQGIGLTKAMHIFHHANAHYITQVTDFFMLADMLTVSATELLGVNLPALTLVNLPAAASNNIIIPADIAQLEKAMAITQLRGEGPCVSLPSLDQDPPELCAHATVNGFGLIVEQTWEDSLQDWTVQELPEVDSTWDAKPWSVTSMLPDGRPGLAILAPSLRAGDCQTDLEKGTVTLTSPSITLPVEEDEFVLAFDHYFATQARFDGGVVNYAINGGTFAQIPSQAFLYNPYTNRLADQFSNDNPLAGLLAFNGRDQNSTSGTWGRSIVDLNAIGVQPGDDLRLQWVMGHDGCEGLLGWYVDDIKIGFCGLSSLPVSFTQLIARPAKDHILVSWATEQELNNAGFYVERQRPDQSFAQLGFVAAGTDYQWRDEAVLGGETYVYRLRQIDVDGSHQYSSLVAATVPTQSENWLIYPNPTVEIMNISGPAGHQQAILYNLGGQQL